MAKLVEVPSFDQYKIQYEETQPQRNSRRTQCAKAYDPSSEAVPDHPWFEVHQNEKDKEVREIVDTVADIVLNARPEDKELLSIQKQCSKTSEIQVAKSSEIAIVGQQGMGKSLLINALQSRRDLSKTSARGGACTASAIKYRHKPGASDTGEKYDSLLEFMNDEYLREIITEHARNYRHFHFGEVDPDCRSEEEKAAKTAGDFFNLLFNTKHDSQAREKLKKFLENDNMGNKFVDVVVNMAHKRIDDTDADEKRVIKVSNKGIKDLMKEVERYVADADDHPSLWPIVNHVTILMGSILARNGVDLVDLPGKSFPRHLAQTILTRIFRAR